MKFVGIDLAWSEENPSGVALINSHGKLVRASGEITTNEDICQFARLDDKEDAIVTIDAPLIVRNSKGQRPVETLLTTIFGPYDAAPFPANLSNPAFRKEGRIQRLVRLLESLGYSNRPEVQRQQPQRGFLEVFPSPAQVILFPCRNRSGHTHCRALRFKPKTRRTWAEIHSEWEIYRARLRSLQYKKPAITFSADVRQAINVDVTAYRAGSYKYFDDLLDGIFCAYLAYYFWYWGDKGRWIAGAMESGNVVLPRCQLVNCLLESKKAPASRG